MSGRPITNPSERPVSTTPVPLSSIACRAARIRSTASSKSKSGSFGSPEESSIESPAIPVSAALADVRRDPVGLDGEAALEVGVDRQLAPRPRCRGGARATGRASTSVSACPSVQANPALVVARAGKPICSRTRALPTSHGFGITKQPAECRRWNSAIRSSGTFMSHLACCLLRRTLLAHRPVRTAVGRPGTTGRTRCPRGRPARPTARPRPGRCPRVRRPRRAGARARRRGRRRSA